MKRLWVLLATAMLCVALAMATSYSKQQPVSNGVESPALAAAAAPPAHPQHHRPAAFGINLFTAAYWSEERAFMNLAAGGAWRSIRGQWSDFDVHRLDGAGTVRSLLPGEQAALALTRPPATRNADVPIHCRFEGKGVVDGVSVVAPRPGPGTLDFIWRHDIDTVHFRIDATDPADPIRNIDCREAGADPKAVFDPAFVDSLRPYKAVRFMDWQQVNNNIPGNWAQRTLPGHMIQATGQGVAVEHMVLLANLAKVDPWFVMPWKADPAYTENFARYVHDHLEPGRTAYVEVGNEIWNRDFPAAQQALAEGMAMKLGKTEDEARMRRYAQHAVEGFKIWERVFADDPKRLVRVLSGQNAWPDLILPALDYKDTAQHVDALSSAVYFGQQLLAEPPADTADLGPLFPKLVASIDSTFETARRFKAIADRHGLRYVAYEGGEHVTYAGADRTLIPRLNRDPRMGDAFRIYLSRWEREFGDLLLIYHSTSPVGSASAFGLAEYSGQPLSETPKRRAVLDAIAATKR